MGDTAEDNVVSENVDKGFSGLKNTLFGDNGFLMNITKSLDSLMDNNVTKTIIIIVLVCYATFVAPNLPNGIRGFIKNRQSGTIVRIIMALAIILLAGNVKTLSLALLLAIGFVITLQNLEELSENVNSENDDANWLDSGGDRSDQSDPEPDNEPVQDEPKVDEADNEQFIPYEKIEGFSNGGSPFVPVEESDDENNRPRHLPYHSVNKKVHSEEDANSDGVYDDDYTQSTKSLLTYNLKQSSFTEKDQFNSVQSNNVPDSDQTKGIQSMNPQQGPQGLNEPVGFNY